MKSKVENSFGYLAGKSKREFQQTITGLLEMHQHLADKINRTKDKQKEAIFFSLQESQLTCDYLFRTITELMTHHETLHQCILHLHHQQQITEAIVGMETLALLKGSLETKSPKAA